MYAARAATTVKDTVLLEKLAADDEDNVREAAIEGLAKVSGHSADSVYVRQMNRNGYQILRAAAAALADTPNPDAAVPALRAAHERLVAESRDNSHDARAAIEKTLAGLRTPAATDRHASSGVSGAPVTPAVSPVGAHATRAGARSVTRETRDGSRDLNADDLRRLAAARALVTMRGTGTFELVLFTWEAPASVLRFARLAEAGYYNGLTFHRVVPNFVIQGGSPGANEYIGDATFMRDEVGQWPHVRGAVGISTRGRDTGDAQIFIDLVDNPRLNHEYTVFAQVLNGMDVIDQVLEGDVIEKIEIVVK
jgi:cyclophilin family peptidyl-prolyl cis-trans isomerase